MFFYGDESVRTQMTKSVWEMNANHHYMVHYSNYKSLKFFAANGTLSEKLQAEKELVLCERKLAFWEKHPRFELDIVLKEKQEEDRRWSS